MSASAIGSSTRAWAAAEKKIRIGYISPKTGPFAPFTEADDFILDQVRKSVAGGVSIGGSTYDVEILVRDDQSSPDRQSNLAQSGGRDRSNRRHQDPVEAYVARARQPANGLRRLHRRGGAQ